MAVTGNGRISARCQRERRARASSWIAFTLLLTSTAVVLASAEVVALGGHYRCRPEDDAVAALQPVAANPPSPNTSIVISPSVAVRFEKGIGYSFRPSNFTLSGVIGGPGNARGAVIIPEKDVHPGSYAPYARSIALLGYFAVIVRQPKVELVLKAMLLYPKGIKFWALLGHGKGAEVAAQLTLTLEPKVKSLVLFGSAVPASTDFSDVNVFVTVAYGGADTLATPAVITASFVRLPGDAVVSRFEGAGHYDFTYSTCAGNTKKHRKVGGGSYFARNETLAATIRSLVTLPLLLAHWAPATVPALSYSDNSKLAPGDYTAGFKMYPPNSTGVKFSQQPIPGTWPQRQWFIFTPDLVKGGFIYYGGGAVDARAYFPLAFQIAARGYLVVIVQQPGRNAVLGTFDALTVLQSKDPAFAGVPKGLWALGGHSAGGPPIGIFATSIYASTIKAYVLHATRTSTDLSNSSAPVLKLDASLDNLVDPKANYTDPNRFKNSWFTTGARINPETTVFAVIPGGSHYQFGDYGYQVGTAVATISREEQLSKVAEITATFLDQHLTA